MAGSRREPRTRGRLPAELTSFIGRGAELRAVRAALATARLVTLTGVGGAGKTRLAVRLGHELRRVYPDGVWHVELGSVAEDDLIGYAVLEVLGLRSGSDLPPVSHVVDYLADRTLLLIVDNCEHVLAGCARLLMALLPACPGLRILCTSRQPLGVLGEVVFPVLPLAVPGSTAKGTARSYPAVALFAERAVAVAPGFGVDTGNEPYVMEICRRLDGLPLAIELAAARLRTLTVEQLAARLTDRFAVLEARHAAQAHHRRLWDTFAWSFELCSVAERELWARLSVFPGSFCLDAATAVCGGDDLSGDAVLEALVGLVDKSVVLRDDAPGPVPYRLLESVREYGYARLDTTDPGMGLVRRRHRDWYRGLAERFDAEWFGPDQVSWAGRMRAELPNVRAALEWCLSTPGETPTGLGLAAALRYYWTGCGALSEGRHWLDRLLAADSRPTAARVRALSARSRVVITQADHAAAAECTAENLRLARTLGDPLLLATASYEAGAAVLMLGGDLARAHALLEEAAAGLAGSATEALTAAMTLTTLALTTLHHGDPAGAQRLCTRAQQHCRERGDRWWLAYSLHASGVVAAHQGAPEEAEAYAREALSLHNEIGDVSGSVAALDDLADAAASSGDDERAARLIGGSFEIGLSAGLDADARRRYWRGRETPIETIRSRCGQERFTAAFEDGRRMGLDEAVAFASGTVPAREPVVGSEPAGVPLTRREREVADLVAQGMSNREIAGRLVISQRTAESHVANLMRKLGMTSRTQVVIWTLNERRADVPR